MADDISVIKVFDDEMEASEESFPASDPPARTVTTGPLAG